MLTTFESRLKNLNKNQKKAVTTIDGPVLVIAGPGSGKTEILSLRVAEILQKTQVLPSQVLCLTFTDSASVNMRDRLSQIISDEAYRVSIHTFHNFCVHIINRYPEYFYKGIPFTAVDPVTKTEILQSIIENLERDHPFRSIKPDGTYVYLSAINQAIEALKRSGLLPQTFRDILAGNKKDITDINKVIERIFSGGRISKKTLETALTLKLEISKKDSGVFPPLKNSIFESLQRAIAEAEAEDSTKPLTEWKDTCLKTDEEGNQVLKESLYQEKMNAVADVYEAYRKAMHENALYDFDDMILDVIEAMGKHKGLLTELQEQYQYILVDEFQDTNNAQMSIVRMIASAEVNENRPNVMVVGDDDQAVYRFQGAEVSNIFNFIRQYKDVSMITMTENYRSTQDILDVASHVIKKGNERLENRYPELEKKLTSQNKDLKKGSIHHIQLPSSSHECHYISREIKRLIENGTQASDIAVIGRKHEFLENLVPFMKGVKVPIKYDHEQNVLQEPHIRELIIIARYLYSLVNQDSQVDESLLPQILAFGFWEIPRIDLFKLATEARQKRYDDGFKYLSIALNSGSSKIKSVAHFLVELSQLSLNEPVERILDLIIGAHVPLVPDNEDEEIDVENNVSIETDFTSPFKQYYFNDARRSHKTAEYLTFLSGLRIFIRSLKDFRHGEDIVVKDLVEFVEIHEKNNLPLNDSSPFSNAFEAVRLLTAHKAKGLEFDTVFVMSCQNEVWAGRGRGHMLPMPTNLPIYPAGDNDDDKLRLFYVALTRAKRNLYLTSYLQNDNGKESNILSYLLEKEGDAEGHVARHLKPLVPHPNEYADANSPSHSEVLTASWTNYLTAPLLNEEKALLASLLEDYKLSVTHLRNFTNVERGGPQLFIEQNLLRFPQSKTPSSSFGTAIHHALEQYVLKLKSENTKPAFSFVEDCFIKALKKERLARKDFKELSKKGIECLQGFLNERVGDFTIKDLTEVDFSDQNVIIEGAHFTGKIDRIVVDGNKAIVHDYKTGKPLASWDDKDIYNKSKIYDYKKQLVFYKILIENSRTYRNLKMVQGVIDFIEPKNGKNISLTLDMNDPEVVELEERIKKVAVAVYKKIMTLDFPDVSGFSKDLKGSVAFEDFILEK
ncbi:MAG: ATP-dependent DNA helicase [bacterium]